MGIMNKLATALRGSVRENAEMIIDANGLRIFAQEIHDCETNIDHAKQQLAAILVEKMRIKRELDSLDKQQASREAKVSLLLKADNEADALMVAELIAESKPLHQRQQQHYQEVSEHANTLQQHLKKMNHRLNTYQTEYRMLKATDNLQSAQSKLSIHRNSTQSRFNDMQSSLSRIQQRQQEFADKMVAMEQVEASLNGSDLVDNKLSAQDILESIRNK